MRGECGIAKTSVASPFYRNNPAACAACFPVRAALWHWCRVRVLCQARRYSPARRIACQTHAITGNTDRDHISASHIERRNLSVRMTNRRFTRLTNAFSTFIKIHRTLRVTPAMAAGVTDRPWDVEDFVAAWEAASGGRNDGRRKRSPFLK